MKRRSVDNISIKDTNLTQEIQTISKNTYKVDGKDDICGVATNDVKTATKDGILEDSQSAVIQADQYEKWYKINKQMNKGFDIDRFAPSCTH